MPRFETALTLVRQVEDVFDFFRRPANILRVSPPDLNLQILEAPELLELGSRIVLQARHWGIAQKLASKITAFEVNTHFVDELQEGPFRKWVQTHRFEAVSEGTRLTYQVDFEPPGGILGMMMKASAIEKDLEAVCAFRAQKLQELLGTTG
jgi:ligand-binding SRPBCC domain-containing protein